MKKIIFTIAIGEHYDKLSKITLPHMADYARRVNATLMCLHEPIYKVANPAWSKLYIKGILDMEKPDIMAYIDIDCVIRENTPDIFAEWDGRFAAYDEATPDNLRLDLITHYGCLMSKLVKPKNYFNTGVFLCGPQHRELFNKPDSFIDSFWEQTYINLRIAETKTEVKLLDRNWNACDRTVPIPDTCYIRHFAGNLRDDSGLEVVRTYAEKYR